MACVTTHRAQIVPPYPDRTPHTGLIEYKNVLRPARIVASDLEKGVVTIWNTLDFTYLRDAIRMTYTVRQNGFDVFTAELALPDIAPHERVDVALNIPDSIRGEYAVHFHEYQLADASFTKAGYLLGEDEIGRQTYEAVLLKDAVGQEIQVSETARHLILVGGNFRYVYNKHTACFDELVHRHVKLLDRPMSYNIWRAPTDNDMKVRGQWEGQCYDRAVSRGYGTKMEKASDGMKLTTSFSIGGIYVPAAVRGTAVWTINNDGTIHVAIDAQQREGLPMLPRFGLRMFMPKAMQRVAYFGYGPHESYSDKHRASFRHLYHSIVAEQHENYLKPQENGSHHDCSYLKVDDGQNGLLMTGDSFCFNVSCYTQEELTQKRHSFELDKATSTVLCLDAHQSGIGSNSCGPTLNERYMVPEHIQIVCTIHPWSIMSWKSSVSAHDS